MLEPKRFAGGAPQQAARERDSSSLPCGGPLVTSGG